MALVLNGTTGVQDNSGAFVAGTAVASTSGSSFDFTSIPSWVQRITVIFNGVSTNGTSIPQIQIGDSGGVEVTGYDSTSFGAPNANNVTTAFSNTGFVVTSFTASTYVYNAVITLVNITGNTWVSSGTVSSSTGGAVSGWGCAGNKTLSAVLDRVRITTYNGTDTFDAGSINILYE